MSVLRVCTIKGVCIPVDFAREDWTCHGEAGRKEEIDKNNRKKSRKSRRLVRKTHYRS